MSLPKWLSDYYGKYADSLNPEVEVDGKTHAIAKLRGSKTKLGHSTIGYVLILKSGRHTVTQHTSLCEGVPSIEDMAYMRMALSVADGGADVRT